MAAVPAVEVADHPHGVGVRGPDGERGADQLLAGGAVRPAHRVVEALDMGAQSLPQALMASLAEQVGVHLPERGQVAVRVVLHDRRAVLIAGAHAVVGNSMPRFGRHGRDDGHEHAVVFVGCLVFAVLGDDGDGFGQRAQDAHGDAVLMLADAQMATEHFVGVVEFGVAHRIEHSLIDRYSDNIFIDVIGHSKSVRMEWSIVATYVEKKRENG